ncbi:hypothetical protein HDE_07848 [Halotydeus destructor]|nr:hypothetical protein HDE_07848 [Halotydeus destructor]
MAKFTALVILSLAVLVSCDPPRPAGQTRGMIEQVIERVYLMQKEFELLVRQFNRIASGQLILNQQQPMPTEELVKLASDLQATHDQLAAFLAPVPADGLAGRQIPGSGLEGIPLIGQLLGSLTQGQGAGLGQFVNMFSGLTSQLQGLTRIMSSLTGGMVRTGGPGGAPGGNPLDQITSLLTGITSQLGSVTGVFRNLGR